VRQLAIFAGERPEAMSPGRLAFKCFPQEEADRGRRPGSGHGRSLGTLALG
jgi:hypothetical protein